MNTQKQIAVIVVLFFMFVAGCAAYSVIDLPVRAVDQADWQHEENVKRGALLFANNCRTCHGIKGQGGVGLPLNKPEFQNQDPLVLNTNKTLLQRTLYCGRAGTRMPPWLNTNGGSLNADQIQHIIDLITSPASDSERQDDGTALNQGWKEAIEFGENLNRETVVVVGGDTLGTIAVAHEIGLAQLSQANGGLDPDQKLEKGTKVNLPTSKTYPQTRSIETHNEGETLRKINEAAFVGAVLIADENNIPFKLNERLGAFSFSTGDSGVSTAAGLIPGKQIALPAGAKYTVRAGDTVESIATQHGLSPSAVLSEADNRDHLGTSDQQAELEFERKLQLPNGTKVLVATGQTLSAIAQQHGLTPANLAEFNGIQDPAAPLDNVVELGLPDGTSYTIQTGDTLASVARAHKMDVTALAQLNGVQPNESISPAIVIQLPKVDKYTIAGQSLDDIRKTFSNVTAKSLADAQTPAVPADHVYAIGSQLKLPADAWGSAPPDTINNGTACLEHIVPQSVFQEIPGIGTPVPAPTAPAQPSTQVKIDAHANDWTVTADNQAQTPNQGAVLVAAGTTVTFTSVEGLHTVTTQQGTAAKVTQNGNLATGDTYDFTFSNAGTYHITCDFHSAMSAYVFVQ